MSYTVVVCEHGYLKRKCPHCENAELTERVSALEAALREGLNLQGRWPLDKKIYPDEAAWVAKTRALLHDSQEEKPNA